MSTKNSSPPTTEIPVDPADITHPRRALSRLALSAAGADASELAAANVPTVSDEFGSAYDTVELAARTVAAAQEVLIRAVVHAREMAGSWEDIAEALGCTTEEAERRYVEAIQWWEVALDEPVKRDGRMVWSQLPAGANEPAWYAEHLDGWCVRHLDEHGGSRHNARDAGVENRMVSANLPVHTQITEWNSVWRTGTHLTRIGARLDSPEWQAYQARKAAVMARAPESAR